MRWCAGNGHTGRLLLNWQLLQAGFPLTVIQVEEQARSSAAWIWRGGEMRRQLDALEEGHTGNLLPLQTARGAGPRAEFGFGGG